MHVRAGEGNSLRRFFVPGRYTYRTWPRRLTEWKQPLRVEETKAEARVIPLKP